MQLLESSAYWEREQPGLQSSRPYCLLPSLEGLLGRGGLRLFLPRHVQLSQDPQFPGCKQGHVPGAQRPAGEEVGACGTWLPSPNAAPSAVTLTSDPRLAGEGPAGREQQRLAREVLTGRSRSCSRACLPGRSTSRSGCIYIHSTGRT